MPMRSRPYSDLMATSLRQLIADDVLDAYPFVDHACLLDIGGGDGAFLVAAAHRRPDLRLDAVSTCRRSRRARTATVRTRERLSGRPRHVRSAADFKQRSTARRSRPHVARAGRARSWMTTRSRRVLLVKIHHCAATGWHLPFGGTPCRNVPGVRTGRGLLRHVPSRNATRSAAPRRAELTKAALRSRVSRAFAAPQHRKPAADELDHRSKKRRPSQSCCKA